MIFHKTVKSVLNRHQKRDSWFLDDYSINPYEGCGFNCQYCYVRGSKYGEHLSEKITLKNDAAAILDRQLTNRARKGQYGIIAVGSSTDAYMQVEQELLQTRALLNVILKNRFPVFISTKSTLITRDIDLLREIDQSAILPHDLQSKLGRGVILSFSISTLDENIARQLEPGAPPPLQRLDTMQKFSEAGFLVGLNALPLLPMISDTDASLSKIVQLAKQYGANFLLAGGLTLFGEQPGDSKTLYYRFLQQYFPDLCEQYIQLFGSGFSPNRQYQIALKKKIEKLCLAYHLKNSII
ncbi:MAG: radical SAM protein [Terrimonas sp.]|nr:radical SAM protein [Terrimonas sp.]